MKTQRGGFFIWVTLLILVTVFGAIMSTSCTNNTGDDARAETEQEMWSVRWTSSDSGEPLVDLELRIYADKVFDTTANNSSSLTASSNAKLYFYLKDEDLSNWTSKLYLTITIIRETIETINYTSTMYIREKSKGSQEQILDMTDWDGSYKLTISGHTESETGIAHYMNRETIHLFIDKGTTTLKSTVSNGAYTNKQFTVEKNTEENWDSVFFKYNGDSKTAPVTTTDYDSMHTDTSITISATASNGWYSFIAVDKAGNQSEVYWVFLDTTPT